MNTNQDIKTELEETIAEINAMIEAELNKLMPILGEETTAIVAMELDIDPARLGLARRPAPSARPVMRRPELVEGRRQQ